MLPVQRQVVRPKTKESDRSGPETTQDIEILKQSLESGGRPLPESVRAYFEPRFGHDFTEVRVHTDSKSGESARAIDASAFTIGRHVVFDEGHYEPYSVSGRRLLAHELTHVIHQTGGRKLGSAVAGLHESCSRNGGSITNGSTLATAPRVQRDGANGGGASRDSDTSREGNPDSEPQTLALPEEHPGRMARLEALKEDIQSYREMRSDLQNKLAALPKVCTDEEETRAVLAQEEVLNNEIAATEDYLIDLLGHEIDIIDEALRGIYDVIPKQSGPDIPEVPAEIWDEINRLEAEKKLAEQERLALRRGRAREQIREIEKQLRELPPESKEREELEKRKKELGEFLSGTATNRQPPGSHGRGSDGRCYVVYQHVVKVGGSLNWRFNNQGSLGPRPADKEWPPGAIGYVPGGTDCGGRVSLLIFADEGASRQAVERWVDEAAHRGSFVGTFLLGYSHEGQKYLTCVHNHCNDVPTGTDAQNGRDSANLGSLTTKQLECVKGAIFFCESGSAAKGDEYSCSDTSAPFEYRRMLGCEE